MRLAGTREVGAGRGPRTPEAEQVGGDAVEALAEVTHQRLPQPRRGRDPVDEQKRRPLAVTQKGDLSARKRRGLARERADGQRRRLRGGGPDPASGEHTVKHFQAAFHIASHW